VIEAKGYTDYPEQLKDVELSKEDKALDPKEKMHKAVVMVHNDDYYKLKNKIRKNMKASLNDLEKMAYDSDASAIESLRDEMAIVRMVIILQALGILFMVWLTSRLGIHPVLNAVDRIQADSPIPEVGANEFRYLARAYNKMYTVYKSSLEHLNFKASHDELTGAYNRSGYELLLSSIDLNSTYMLLFDVDDFKSINDNYGHEAGDLALKRLVQVLRNNFRSDDYICRLGGDEFVVFMVHSTEMQHNLITSKIEEINRELAVSEAGMPPISVSVGIMHGSEAADAKTLFEKTDEAMYQAKQRGKHTFAFYQQ
jgi:diguanylate cyclase (GGDEF)-like protein